MFFGGRADIQSSEGFLFLKPREPNIGEITGLLGEMADESGGKEQKLAPGRFQLKRKKAGCSSMWCIISMQWFCL